MLFFKHKTTKQDIQQTALESLTKKIKQNISNQKDKRKRQTQKKKEREKHFVPAQLIKSTPEVISHKFTSTCRQSFDTAHSNMRQVHSVQQIGLLSFIYIH